MTSSQLPPSFADDLEFLKQHGDVIVLRGAQGAAVAISPKYQARVMTSAVTAGGRSLGWVNRSFIAHGRTGTAFDNYGGEDRFWLGPEGGQYAVFFAPGAPFELSRWQTPSGFQEGAWEPLAVSDSVVDFQRTLRVQNRAGSDFDIGVERRLALMDAAAVESALGIAPGRELEWVAFRSDNKLTNVGQTAWNEQTGLVSIWSLGMFVPADDTRVVVPFDKSGAGRTVNANYFGTLTPDRLKVDETNAVVTFLADGRYRSKIGLSQSRSTPVAGSYTPSERRLTIIRYSVPSAARPFVNSTWEEQAQPYAGDLFNAYNHGLNEPGQLADVRFYELESSSPGAVLGPGESLRHEHQTFHFLGERSALDAVARRVLGVSLSAVTA